MKEFASPWTIGRQCQCQTDKWLLVTEELVQAYFNFPSGDHRPIPAFQEGFQESSK
jgi:hypothetical protein